MQCFGVGRARLYVISCRLAVFVQFVLGDLQTHGDIRGRLGPAKKLEVITEALPLSEPGDCRRKDGIGLSKRWAHPEA